MIMSIATTVRTGCLVVIGGGGVIFACLTAEVVGSIPAEAIFNYSGRFRTSETFAIDYRAVLKRPTGTLELAVLDVRQDALPR